MRVRLRGAVALVVLAACGWPVGAYAQAVESRYTRASPHSCPMQDHGGDEADWVLYRCAPSQGGLAVWLAYADGTNLRFSFGIEDFEGAPFHSADRDENWPIEWRGTGGARFVPYAAIVRVRPPPGLDDDRSRLAVFAVHPERPSCFLGTSFTNAGARALADDVRAAQQCRSVVRGFR